MSPFSVLKSEVRIQRGVDPRTDIDSNGMCSSDRGTTQINGSCHCGANSFTVGLPTASLPILTSPPPALISDSSPSSGLKSYKASPNGTRLLCSTCGAHIIRFFKGEGGSRYIWELATGVLDRSSNTMRTSGLGAQSMVGSTTM